MGGRLAEFCSYITDDRRRACACECLGHPHSRPRAPPVTIAFRPVKSYALIAIFSYATLSSRSDTECAAWVIFFLP